MLQNLFRGLPRNLVAAHRAVRRADGGVQQAQIIVDLGDGPDGGTRAAAGGLLLDGNGRAETVDGIDIGPLHLVQELARIGRERLHIAPLPLRVNGVERQRRLARAAEPRDHRKGVPRDLDIDVFQVVLARAMHGDPVQHSELRLGKGDPSLWRGLCRFRKLRYK